MTAKRTCATCGKLERVGSAFCPRCGTADPKGKIPEASRHRNREKSVAHSASLADIRNQLRKVELERLYAEKLEKQFSQRGSQPPPVPSLFTEMAGPTFMIAVGGFLATRHGGDFRFADSGVILVAAVGFIVLIRNLSTRSARIRSRTTWEAGYGDISKKMNDIWSELHKLKEAESRGKPSSKDTGDNHIAPA